MSWKPTENILSMRNLLTVVKDGYANTLNEQMWAYTYFKQQ